jgi:8-oxo-dGTP pyrophosphatase MutT (NUDIX family)
VKASDPMHTREQLLKAIRDYKTPYEDEANFIRKFLNLLQHPRSFHRDHLPGHITGSAWIIDHSKQFVLLTHHAKLNRWLQPGGHADGDDNISRVCTREAVEETGLSSLQLISEGIFDIDIHTIPERNDFPQHQHYDVRLLFNASMSEPLQITAESHDLKWVALTELEAKTGNNVSMLRMAEKTRHLL